MLEILKAWLYLWNFIAKLFLSQVAERPGFDLEKALTFQGAAT